MFLRFFKKLQKKQKDTIYALFLWLFISEYFFSYIAGIPLRCLTFFADVYNSFVRVNKGLSVCEARERKHIFA